MKKTLFTLFVAAILGFAGMRAYQIPYSPCDTPITYKLGMIDPNFKREKDELLAATKEGAGILSDARGNDLFVYSPDEAELTVNFVYDERTALVENINEKLSQVDRENLDLKERIRRFESDVLAFQAKLDNFNATVDQYNRQGGAPPEVYDELTEKQRQLRSEADSLNIRASELNLETNSFNSQVNLLNQNVSKFNQAISQKPEEGIYDPANNSITIYFVDNHPELVHTLAHEFGHALGMEHVDDSNAIMYTLTSQSLVMVEDDINQLNKVCQSYPMPVHWINSFLTSTYDYFAKFKK
jgi:peptidoglycan hydrolase CwlO-like protein